MHFYLTAEAKSGQRAGSHGWNHGFNEGEFLAALSLATYVLEHVHTHAPEVFAIEF